MTSGGSYNAILVEKFNSFLNKGLCIFCSERDTTWRFIKGFQMLTYAWNLDPIAETYMLRSLVTVGR